MAKDAKKDIDELNKELSKFETVILGVASRLSDVVRETFEDIRNEASSLNEIFRKNIDKSIKDITKNSDKILENTLKLYKGESKISDISKMKSNLLLKELSIKRNLNSLVEIGVISEEDAKKQEEEVTQILKEQNKLLDNQISLSKKINNNMGVTGNIVKGISKIPVLKDLIDSENILSKVQTEAVKETTNRTKVMNTAFKVIGQSIKENLSDPIIKSGVVITTLGFILNKVSNLFKGVDQEAGDMAKSIGVSYNYALGLNERLRDTAINSSKIGINFKELSESQKSFSDEFGVYNKIADENLNTQSQLTKLIGLQGEETIKIFKTSAARGISEDKFIRQIYGANTALNQQQKTFISQKHVVKEIASTSNAIKLSIKGGTEALVNSVREAQKLGLSLNKIDNIADSLLNFEQSITAELEAELVTGQDLNLERARYYALNNDINGLMREINAQGITSHKFANMNRIAQEKTAAALGMSREEMSDMFTEQESLNQLKKTAGYQDIKDLEAAEKKFKLRVKDVGYSKALQELGESEFANNMKTLSVQESMNEAMIRLSDTIKSIVDGPIGKLLGKVNGILSKISETPWMSKLVGNVIIAGAAVAGIASIITLGKQMLQIFGLKKGVQSVYVTNMDGTGFGGNNGDESILDTDTGRRNKRNRMPRNVGRSGSRGGMRRISQAFKMGGKKGGFKALSRMARPAMKTASKFLKGGGITAAIGAGIDLADFLSNEKTRKTGIGGFLESFGGSSMSAIDWIPGLNQLTEAIGLGIDNMNTANLANARAIYRSLHPEAPTIIPNKILIGDINKNPDNYTEDIIDDVKDVDISKLEKGGLVTQGGVAKVDTGEVYLGGNSLGVLKSMLDSLQEQNKYLKQLINKDQNIYMDSIKVGTAFSLNT